MSPHQKKSNARFQNAALFGRVERGPGELGLGVDQPGELRFLGPSQMGWTMFLTGGLVQSPWRCWLFDS